MVRCSSTFAAVAMLVAFLAVSMASALTPSTDPSDAARCDLSPALLLQFDADDIDAPALGQVQDLSGFEQHGAMNSASIAGRFDLGIQTAQGTDGIELAATQHLKDATTGDFTMLFWMNTTTPGNTGNWFSGQWIYDRDSGGGGRDMAVTLVGNNIVFFAQDAGGAEVSITGSTDVVDGIWHAVAVTREAATGKLSIYVDGSLDAQATYDPGPLTPNGEPFHYVAGSDTSTDYEGLLDEFRIYDHLLSPSQAFDVLNAPYDQDGFCIGPDADGDGLGDAEEGGATPPTGGLVAYYAFDGDASDSSGNGLDGAFVGGAATTPGPCGQELSIGSAGGQYVSVADPGDALALSTYTVATWIYWDGTAGYNTIAVKGTDGGETYGFYINNNGDGSILSQGTGHGLLYTPPGSITPNTWTHFAATLDGTSHDLYVDGVLVATTGGGVATPGNGLGAPLRIGHVNTYQFHGQIDDFVVYDHALAPSTIGDAMAACGGIGTDPYDPDTDDDGLLDGDEVNMHGTDPLVADTDGDGLDDGREVHGADTGAGPCAPEAATDGLGVLYRLDIPLNSNLDGSAPAYAFDAGTWGPVSTVGYCLELDGAWAYTSFASHNASASALGIPYNGLYQQTVSGLRVASNQAITTGAIGTGNIEFWSDCYNEPNAAGVPGASDATNDFGDATHSGPACYGSMQVHNTGAGETVWAYNAWDWPHHTELGIGNAPSGDPDWTWAANTGAFTTRTLTVYANSGPPTDPLASDTDADGLTDGDEVNTYGTDPTVDDTDGDGLLDGDEVTHGTDLFVADTDGDGLNDGDEVNVHGSDPVLVDTDGDSLTDGAEVTLHGTDPASADTDGDGLLDYQEINVHGTDPLLADTDGDTLSDLDEVTTGGGGTCPSPLDADSDDDGISDQTDATPCTYTQQTLPGGNPWEPWTRPQGQTDPTPEDPPEPQPDADGEGPGGTQGDDDEPTEGDEELQEEGAEDPEDDAGPGDPIEAVNTPMNGIDDFGRALLGIGRGESEIQVRDRASQQPIRSEVKGEVLFTYEGQADAKDLRVVLYPPQGDGILLATGTTEVPWDSSQADNGVYDLQWQERKKTGGFGITSDHYRVLESRTIVVRNPDAEPAQVAGAVAAGTAVAAVGSIVASRITVAAEIGKESAIAFGEDTLKAATDRGTPRGFFGRMAAGLHRTWERLLGQDAAWRRTSRLYALLSAPYRFSLLALAWTAKALTKGIGAIVGATTRLIESPGTLGAIALTVVALTLFFSAEAMEGWSLRSLLANAPIVGAAALLFGILAIGAETLVARASGSRVSVKMYAPGFFSLALSALMFRSAFGYPSFVDEEDSEQADHMPDYAEGIRAIAVLGSLAGIAGMFVILGLFSFGLMEEGIAVVAAGLAGAALPVKPLPGYDIFAWNKAVGVAVYLGALAFFVATALAWINVLGIAIIGLVAFATYVLIAAWLLGLRWRAQREQAVALS